MLLVCLHIMVLYFARSLCSTGVQEMGSALHAPGVVKQATGKPRSRVR